MIIKIERPPIFDRASKLFDFANEEILFAWGDTLYNPGNIEVDRFLIAHEETHSRQQEEKGGPDDWWELYLNDDDFRASQEAQAYGEQFRRYCLEYKDRNRRAAYLHQIAVHLSSPLYKLTINYVEAKQAILERHFRRKL